MTRGDVWVAGANGRHPAFLVHDGDTPTWVPTGRRLAFVRDGNVWTVRAAGLDQHRLARSAHPAWSPSGQRIALDRGGLVVTLRTAPTERCDELLSNRLWRTYFDVASLRYTTRRRTTTGT